MKCQGSVSLKHKSVGKVGETGAETGAGILFHCLYAQLKGFKCYQSYNYLCLTHAARIKKLFFPAKTVLPSP